MLPRIVLLIKLDGLEGMRRDFVRVHNFLFGALNLTYAADQNAIVSVGVC